MTFLKARLCLYESLGTTTSIRYCQPSRYYPLLLLQNDDILRGCNESGFSAFAPLRDNHWITTTTAATILMLKKAQKFHSKWRPPPHPSLTHNPKKSGKWAIEIVHNENETNEMTT